MAKSQSDIAAKRYTFPVRKIKGPTALPNSNNRYALHPTTDGKSSSTTTFPQTRKALIGGEQ